MTWLLALRKAWPFAVGAAVIAALAGAGVTLHQRGRAAGALEERGRLQTRFTELDQAYRARLDAATERARGLQREIDEAEAQHRARASEVARRGQERARRLGEAIAKPAPDTEDVADLRRSVEDLEARLSARRMEHR